MPRPTLFSDTCMTLQRPPGHVSTRVTSLASTTQPTHHHEESLDHLTCSSLLSPSPSLFGPTFAMCQNLQLGPQALTLPPSDIDSIGMLAGVPSSTGSVKDAARKSLLQQQLGMMPNHL